MKSYAVDESVKSGGDQIEYQDEDPQIRRMFEQELAKQGVACCMDPVTGRLILLHHKELP